MNFRISIPLIIAIYAACVIASAYFIEYVLGYKPCELCIIQRYPYYLIILSSIALFALKSRIIPINLSHFLFKRTSTAAYVVIILASIIGFSLQLIILVLKIIIGKIFQDALIDYLVLI